jgi:predicted MFS family arabinose efflux permease
VAAEKPLTRQTQTVEIKQLAPRLVIFTFIRTTLNTAHRMVYPFLSAFARGLGVDLTVLSGVMAARALVATIGPFAATLADRLGRKVGILLGVGLFSLGAGLVLAWPTFWAFAAALIVMTLGKYVFDISLVSWIGDRTPYERRGRVLAFTEFGWSLAFIVGVPLVGFAIARLGWNSPYLFFASLGVVAFVVLWFIIPGDGKGSRLPHDGSASLSLAAILRSPAWLSILAVLCLGLFSSAANETVNLLFGVWLEQSFGLQIAALGAASAVIGLSELGGEGLVAAFVDRIGKPRAVALGLTVNSLAALALPLLGRSATGALIGLFFFYISFEFTIVSSIPLMTEVLPEARATVLALNVAGLSLGRALGAFTAPRLYALGFWAVAAGAVIFNLLAVLALWQAARRTRPSARTNPQP